MFAGAEAWTAREWGAGAIELVAVFAACATALFTAGVGVFYRQMWARWIGLAAGLAGLCNALVFRVWFGSWTVESLFFVAISVILLGSLGGRRMTRAFGADLKPQSVFQREGHVVRSCHAAIITGIAAIPSLLLLGAWIPAAFLSIGAIAAWRERAAGILLLGVGSLAGLAAGLGPGLSAHLLLPLLGLAGACGLAANLALARPTVAYLRSAEARPG